MKPPHLLDPPHSLGESKCLLRRHLGAQPTLIFSCLTARPSGSLALLTTCASQDSVQNAKSTQFRGTVPPSIASGYKAQLPIRTGASPENWAGKRARRVRVLALPED